MYLEKANPTKYCLTKHFCPRVTGSIQSMAVLNDKIIALDSDRVIRIFTDFKGTHLAFPLGGRAVVYTEIVAVPSTDYIVLWNESDKKSVAIMDIRCFGFEELTGFSGICSVVSEEKALTIVDIKGVHIYYICEGYSKLNVIKVGYIQLTKINADLDASRYRHYIAKQSYYTLYLLKFVRKTQNDDFHYTMKLYYISKFFKGYYRKASVSLKQPVIDMVPLGPRCLIAILTADNTLQILDVESESLIIEPNRYSSMRPYKIMNMGANGELLVIEPKRLSIIDIINNWNVVFENKNDGEAHNKLVNDVVCMAHEKIIFNEDAKICIIKRNNE